MKDYANTNPEILKYIHETFRPEDAQLRQARENSEHNRLPEIQVGSMDGLHLEIIARACGARKAVEIGTLGGYSGISLARALLPGGKLFTFEADRRHAEVARENFAHAGVSDRTEVFIGPAMDNLPLIQKEGPFDLVFIDADKANYPNYLRWAAENLKVGGALLGDNTLAFGMIADVSFENAEDEETVRALREFNREVAQGGRFRATLLPTGEGLTFAVKIR